MEARAVEQAWKYHRVEKQHLLADRQQQQQQQQEQSWDLTDSRTKKKKKPRTVRLGGTSSSSSRWRWRIKLGRRKMKLKLNIFSPAASVLRRLRDAYVKSMVALSSNKNAASLAMSGHIVSASPVSAVKPTTASKSRSSRSPSLVSWNSNSQVMSNRDLQRLCSLHLHMERS